MPTNPFIHQHATLDHWQTQTERATEAGALADDASAPQLHLGPLEDALAGLPGQRALHAFANQRRDLAAPTVLAGGDSGSWLLALAQQHSAPPLVNIDAGTASDQAASDQAASDQAASNQMSSEARQLLPLHVLYGGVDRATYAASSDDVLAWQVAPAQQPGAPLAWSALPFVPTGLLRAQARWTAWGGVALALALFLAALIA